MANLTSDVTRKIASLMKLANVREAMRVMSDRSYMFKNDLGMKLTAISLIPDARTALDDFMESRWTDDTIPYYSDIITDELIIGGGIHGAIYAASRVAAGNQMPLVLERTRPGGIFAVSRRPSFYLNSNNRPGKIALPGDNLAALNYLPGAPIQPSFVSPREYQTNADLAWIIRLTHALVSNVRRGNATGIEYDPYSVRPGTARFTTTLDNGAVIRSRRIIDATGIGEPREVSTPDNRLVQTYPQFLASLDAVCPLRGLERVAVIGGGDSGKTAVEALLGIGPDAMMTVTGLDYVRSIDWYSENLPQRCDTWRETERGRYQRIGSYLPRDGKPGRLTVIGRRGQVAKALDSVLVNGQSYDRVIDCSGFSPRSLRTSGFDSFDSQLYPGIGEPIARKYSGEYYAVGPAANLDFTSNERLTSASRILNNRVAIFRTANRTSALATRLD